MVQRFGDLLVERNQGRAGIFHLRCLAFDVCIGRDTPCATLLHQRERFLREVGGLIGQHQPLLLIAQADIRLRHFSGQRYLGVGEIGLDRIGLSRSGLGSASCSAEQVEFP